MTAGLVLYFSLILARVGAFVVALPVLGGSITPRLVKAALVLALSVLYFGLHFPAGVEAGLLKDAAGPAWVSYGVAVGRELVLGAVLGFAFSLFLVPARVAGQFITQTVGLSFGELVSPTGSAAGSPITLILEGLATLLFLGLDGHHLCLVVLHGTFTAHPLGGTTPEVPIQAMVQGVSLAEEWGLTLALPVVLCLFVSLVVLALMTRAAPQLNLYSIGFPLQLAIGLAVMVVLMPNLVAGMVNTLGRLGELVLRLV